MAPIAKARWELLSPLLDELLPLDGAARAARIAQVRRDDAALADHLQTLLDQEPAINESGFLETPASLPPDERPLAGQVLGSYTLDRVLGQGGMGTVWLAHRSDGRYEAHVAVKLLNLALLGPSGSERFQREGKALGRLTHPNIARLVDAGVTSAGQPYLVLDYVEGEALTEWTQRKALDVKARVRLFLQVLAAVAHAHSKLILHRDLKPTNILVTPDGQVKLLDFGIAKLLDAEGDAASVTQLTGLGAQPCTPEYAAPEQLLGAEVTTATDVYALGALLYVVLTGRHPTVPPERDTPLERMRAVIDTNPLRPSDVAVHSVPDASLLLSAQHSRALRGDLDNIVLKALKKVPAERYRTVEALAEDLCHYLDGEPVSARADSLSYRMTKFVTRHKLIVGATAVVFATVVAAAIVSFWQAREATRQRDRALSLATRNEAVVDFVGSMLTEIAPADQPVRVKDLLDSSQKILMSDGSNPEHQAAILSVLASAYLATGNAQQADAMLTRSLALTKSSRDAALRAVLLCDSAFAKSLVGRHEESQMTMDQGLALSRADVMANVRCLRDRGFIAMNANAPAVVLEFTLQAQERLRDSPIAKPDLEAELLADIAYAHYLSGHTGAADKYFAESLAKLAAIGRADNARVLFIWNNWGISSFSAGDNLRALEHYDEALRIAKHHSLNGEPPPYLLANRALALSSMARYPEALAAYDEAIASAERSGNVAARASNISNRAGTYLLMGDVARAEQELAGLLPEIGKSVAPDSTAALSAMQTQARIASARGRTAEALAGYAAVLEFFDSRGMAISPVVRVLIARAEIKIGTGDTAAAQVDADRALRVARTLQADKAHSSLTGFTLALLARLHESRGEHAKAVTTAQEATSHLADTLGADHPETVKARQFLASLQASPSPSLQLPH